MKDTKLIRLLIMLKIIVKIIIKSINQAMAFEKMCLDMKLLGITDSEFPKLVKRFWKRNLKGRIKLDLFLIILSNHYCAYESPNADVFFGQLLPHLKDNHDIDWK